jgi:hypothetical protein
VKNPELAIGPNLAGGVNSTAEIVPRATAGGMYPPQSAVQLSPSQAKALHDLKRSNEQRNFCAGCKYRQSDAMQLQIGQRCRIRYMWQQISHCENAIRGREE